MWLFVIFISSTCICSPNGPPKGLSLLLWLRWKHHPALTPVIEMACSDWLCLSLGQSLRPGGEWGGGGTGFCQTQIAGPRAPPGSCGGRGISIWGAVPREGRDTGLAKTPGGSAVCGPLCCLPGDLYTQAAEAAMEALKGRLANQYYQKAEEAWAQMEP